MSGLAPAIRRSSTTLWWPSKLADNSGVQPSYSEYCKKGMSITSCHMLVSTHPACRSNETTMYMTVEHNVSKHCLWSCNSTGCLFISLSLLTRLFQTVAAYTSITLCMHVRYHTMQPLVPTRQLLRLTECSAHRLSLDLLLTCDHTVGLSCIHSPYFRKQM